jgi:hypothetical protein
MKMRKERKGNMRLFTDGGPEYALLNTIGSAVPYRLGLRNTARRIASSRVTRDCVKSFSR